MTGRATDPGCCPTCGEHKNPRLLTVKEAAAAVGRSEQWIRANADALGAITMGDGPKPRRYFLLDALTDCLRSRQSVPVESPQPQSIQPPTKPARKTTGGKTTYRIED